MKINFAQVPAEDVDTFGDESLFGPDSDGNFYYNRVEFGTNAGGVDEVSIQDGCDRYMPIACEHIPDLITALHEIYRVYACLQVANSVADMATSDTESFVDGSTLTYA